MVPYHKSAQGTLHLPENLQIEHYNITTNIIYLMLKLSIKSTN